MIIEVKNESEFKNLCRNAWKRNAQLWIEGRKLPIRLRYYLLNEILNEKKSISILDIGCGNGWLFDEILNFNPNFDFSYIGLDTSDLFISHLNKSVSDKRAEFIIADFEEELTQVEDCSIDKAIAVLSFIEMTDLKYAFYNVYRKLKSGGKCIIVVLNPYLELMRLNSDINDLRNDLSVFRSGKMYYYEKKIVSDDLISEVNYYGLLHHIDNYFSIAKGAGLQINDFKEIDAIDEFGPGSTVYHCIQFNKPLRHE